MPLIIIGGTALAIGIGATAYSISEQQGAKKDARRANELAAKKEMIQSRRQRMEQLRQARIMQGTIAQQGQNQGVSGASGVTGAMGAVDSQTAANMSFIDKLGTLGQGMLDAQASYQTAQANSAIGGQVAGVAFNIASMAGSYSGKVKAPATPATA